MPFFNRSELSVVLCACGLSVAAQLIRHKLKQLVDPTRLTRFPFRTPLNEHPTTYLAQKHRGLVTARKILKRRCDEAALLGGPELLSPSEDRRGGGRSAFTTVSHGRVSAKAGAKFFLFFWFMVLLLPEQVQDLMIDDIMGFGTVGFLYIVQACRARAAFPTPVRWVSGGGRAGARGAGTSTRAAADQRMPRLVGHVSAHAAADQRMPRRAGGMRWCGLPYPPPPRRRDPSGPPA